MFDGHFRIWSTVKLVCICKAIYCQ